MASSGNPQKLKVAIVHDWLYGGGAERVVLEMHRMFPDAPIYTSYCSDEWLKRLDNKVVTGFLQHWPFNRLRKFVGILRIWWFTHLDFSGYDLVISSTGNGEAKGIRVPEGTLHICYCHAPTHFYWRYYEQYLRNPGVGVFSPLARLGLQLLVSPLRRWDYKAAQRPHYFIANSSHIKSDIKKYYGRDATIIHPPVDIERFTVAAPSTRSGFVIGGRQVPQKRMDLAILACNKLGLPLTVIGDGPEHTRLKKLSGPTITFVGRIADSEMPGYFARAQAFIFPSFEDFGVIPVEAMAAGTPVIAYGTGGALDYIIAGKTGMLFTEQTVASLCEALTAFDASQFDHTVIHEHAKQFSAQVFTQKMDAYVKKALLDFK